MKVAVPTRDSVVDDHFGHCAYYTIFNIIDGKVASRETLPSPQGCGCKSNIASVLAQMGVRLMLAGNMGDGAKTKLAQSDIQVIRGCHGNVEDVVAAYIRGELKDSQLSCDHHDCAGH